MQTSRILGLVLVALCVFSAWGLTFTAKTYDEVLKFEDGEKLLRASATTLQAKLAAYKLNIVTAESLTAGKIISTIVDITGGGANKYGGFAVYDSDAKRRYLGVMVPNVYSESCSRQMARGALKRSRAAVAVAVTGHAAQSKTGQLGNVDLAISIRTKGSKKSEIETLIKASPALYAGFPVEGTDKAAPIGWGVPEYNDEKRLLDSGDYATYHVHLSICQTDHGFAGTKAKCDDLKKEMEESKPYNVDLNLALRDVIRRTVVYAALELTREVLDKAFDGKDVDTFIKPAIEVFPAGASDNEARRHHCWEPSDLIRRYIAGTPGTISDKKCHEQAHIGPADIQTIPDFLEEEVMLRSNH